MAAFPATPQVSSIPGPGGNTGTAATFIPQIWSDEVIAEYEKSLVLANLVKKMSMKGKKGDVIHVPSPIRGNASVKASATSVTLLADVENEFKETKAIQKMYVEALASETKMSENYVRKLMNKKTNVYLNAEEAVKLGIADIIF